jgi:membrane protein YqaA with SNARE-associated domain
LVISPAQRFGCLTQVDARSDHLAYRVASPQLSAQLPKGPVGYTGHGRYKHIVWQDIGTDAHAGEVGKTFAGATGAPWRSFYLPKISAIEIRHHARQHSAAQTAYTGLPMDSWIAPLLSLLALPQYSLATVFLISFISASLLPMGSEPAVLGLISLNPGLYWPVILVATLGNTLGGALDWWMGYGAWRMTDKYRQSKQHMRALAWLEKLGPKACLLAWLPLVGDPLCAVAGWLKLPFLQCLMYMAVGKFVRYVVLTETLLGTFNKFWPAH